MNWNKTWCHWCPQLYASPGAYANNLAKIHPEEKLFKSRKHRFNDCSDREGESEGSDEEVRNYCSDAESAESDGESQQSEALNTITQPVAGTPIREHFFPEQDLEFNLYSPFRHPVDYRLAHFFNAVHASEKKIDQFFKNGILQALNPTHRVQFQSAHTMYKLVDKAADEPCWYSGKVDYPLLKGVQFHYRNIISTVKYLLRQKVYAADMVWGPRREYDKQENRIYSEMNTGTWWEDAQLSLPERGTLVPILLASDQTHLTNFSGDKKLWPVYISIGNIRSSIQNTPTMHSWIPIAFLPIGPKRVKKIPGYSPDMQEIQALQTTHDVLTQLLKPLADTACQKGYEMICADGNIRLCFPKLFCWLADHMENTTLHGITSNRCPTCIILTEKLGEYSETSYLTRSYQDYILAYNKSDMESLNTNSVKNIKNALWSIPNLNPPDLVRADILHNVLLGVFEHLMRWIQGFLEHHNRIIAFDYAYRVISQWSGKEMWNFSKVILRTFVAALRRNMDQARPTGAQIQEFNRAIHCVCSITDFYLMTQYDSHTDETISYLEKYLCVFHETKDVFLRFRAGKVAKRAAAEAHKDLLQEQKQAEASVKHLTVLEKVKLQQGNTFERRELVDEILKEGSHYNFPKIHLISYYAEQIPKFGTLSQYSTEISETMHKAFKDAYRRSNRVDTLLQITRIRQGGERGEPTGGVGKPPTTRRQVYLKLRGKIEFGRVGNIAELEHTTAVGDLTLATQIFLTRDVKCTDSDIQRLLEGNIRAYKTLDIPVPKLSGNGFVVHHARCTGLDMFRKQQRSDWVWVRRHRASDVARPGTLNGRIPGRLNALFKLKSKEGIVYRVANVSLLQCIGGSSVQGAEGMLRVGWGGREESVVVQIAKVEGMAHLIPLEPGESWLVNNRIDLETWDALYD
ncbi:hypothetical protein BGX38DRAFT_1205503 [Terfezia claveryi]|nr:hypothetical protein BGX38DRAFT_1205503 [Terfezia claveryi]